MAKIEERGDLVKKQQLLLPKKATAAILPSEVSKNRNILCKSIKKVSKNRNIVVGNLLSKKGKQEQKYTV